MKALARCRDHQAGKPRIPATPYGVAFPRRPDRAGVRKLLDPNEAFALLTPLGLSSPEHAVVRNAAEGIAPVEETTAHGMIEEIRGAALLKGFRGQPPSDRQALVAALVNVSRLLVERPEITAIDINPFVVFREGEGGLVVDVKVETATLVPAPLTG